MKNALVVLTAVIVVSLTHADRAGAQTQVDFATVIRGESVTVDVLANDDPGLTLLSVDCSGPFTPRGFSAVANPDGTITFSADDVTGCPAYFNCVYETIDAEGRRPRPELIKVSIICPPECPCGRFTITDFGPPMGKKKQLGSTLPLKFQLFFDGVEVTSQEQLDALLVENGCEVACPEIVITDLTDPANEFGLELPEDLGNVGEGGELGVCFRHSAPNWIYNLALSDDVCFSGRTYQAAVAIGPCLLSPGNDLFQIK